MVAFSKISPWSAAILILYLWTMSNTSDYFSMQRQTLQYYFTIKEFFHTQNPLSKMIILPLLLIVFSINWNSLLVWPSSICFLGLIYVRLYLPSTNIIPHMRQLTSPKIEWYLFPIGKFLLGTNVHPGNFNICSKLTQTYQGRRTTQAQIFSCGNSMHKKNPYFF